MMFGLIKRSTHEAVVAELNNAQAKVERLDAENDRLTDRISMLRNEARGLQHELAVLATSLTGKTDQAAHYRDILTEIRGMRTDGANATVKRMAARAEYALQTYACVAEGVA